MLPLLNPHAYYLLKTFFILFELSALQSIESIVVDIIFNICSLQSFSSDAENQNGTGQGCFGKNVWTLRWNVYSCSQTVELRGKSQQNCPNSSWVFDGESENQRVGDLVMKPTISPLLFLTRSFSTVGISFDAKNEGFWGSKYRTLGGAPGCLGNLDQVLWLSAVL